MDGIIGAILGFIEDVFEAITNLITWIGDLAQRIEAIELSSSSITLIMGNFRYLIGDTLYIVFISTFYIGVFMVAFKTIPIVVSWWKHFSPTS